MVRVSTDGTTTPLRSEAVPLGDALWRDDASGVLLAVWDAAFDESIAGRLTWIDSAGSAPLSTSVIGSRIAWADTARALYAGDCSLLPSVSWQPPANRAFSSGTADLQARLNVLGLNAGQADGYFGDQTRSALQAYQRSHNLPSSDTLDCATWQSLLGKP
ncbi:MAG: peptidoglycan-binding protein [Oscillochloris sp.]|nr:peptidoglycan-binding protein [Oscillochloris sp.]